MIEIQNLTKKFGKLTALKDVSINCERGECIALIGANGSGKTTLIKSIFGMVIPDTGKVLFDGKPVDAKGLYRRNIGYMPQIGRYPDNMSIGQVIGMMKDIRIDKTDWDEELISAFGVDQMMDKRMHTLSGGTRQKVSAILAFLFNPEVLILDEPTAGLDPLASEILREKIIKENKKGKLVFITSHILSDLNDLITHVIYMNEGKLLFKKSLPNLQKETGEEKLSRAVSSIMKELEL
ncbi:MAG: ABC transporter ATP-binding protein [Bacteroidia bacterium]|nr:ABC transporter ATP-binding protein [Bacteroidia bacterium]